VLVAEKGVERGAAALNETLSTRRTKMVGHRKNSVGPSRLIDLGFEPFNLTEAV
jgi:hypothetical protein